MVGGVCTITDGFITTHGRLVCKNIVWLYGNRDGFFDTMERRLL